MHNNGNRIKANCTLSHIITITIAFSMAFSNATTAHAQTNLETNAGIQFNFSPPGAGSLALGGAFIALADDATAAYTNPAGLTNLLDQEFHAEIRSWRFTHIFTDRESSPDETILEAREKAQRDGKESDNTEGVSFLSYVYPYKKWAVAIYRHELANFEANFTTRAAFIQPLKLEGLVSTLDGEMKLSIVNHGISTAYQLHPSLSIGIGLSYFEFSSNSRADRFQKQENQQQSAIQNQYGNDSDWSFNGGILWQDKSQTWSIGGSYRQGPEFDMQTDSITISKAGTSTESGPATFQTPDVWGFGFAAKPTDATRITFDYVQVEYSDMVNSFQDIFRIVPGDGRDPEIDKFKIDDADELHLGFEYSIYRSTNPILLRIGTWYDPDHSLRFEGENEALQAVFRRRSDEMHYSFGLGISRRKFQIDVAFDYSERVSTASLSAVFRY